MNAGVQLDKQDLYLRQDVIILLTITRFILGCKIMEKISVQAETYNCLDLDVICQSDKQDLYPT